MSDGTTTYVMDRWYAQFALFNDIHDIGSSYGCRVRDNSRYEVFESHPPSMAAQEVNVLSDEIIELGLSKKRGERPGGSERDGNGDAASYWEGRNGDAASYWKKN